jgi:hypothetical protein
VFAPAGDPLASGLIASLARPGGNITGLSNQTDSASEPGGCPGWGEGRVLGAVGAGGSAWRHGLRRGREAPRGGRSRVTNSVAIGGTADMPRSRRARRSEAFDPLLT